ncbi:MAG: NADH-quinone oxidoreductase, chain, partial [Acidimicrobiales bacterium]|nr:NADH-quinone oxidoreductase, chain [Acidimicrobiales bacterium]
AFDFDVWMRAIDKRSVAVQKNIDAGDTAAASADAAEGEGDTEAAAGDADTDDAVARAAARPGAMTFSVPEAPAAAPSVDAYSLRLVTVRKLYDLGTLVQTSPSIAALGHGGGVSANPYDIDRLGVADGGQVRLTSSRGSLTASVRADAGVSRGTVAMEWNRGEPSPALLIDATQPVTDVRVETTG